MADIKEHLAKHDAVLRAEARKIARAYGQPDLAEDCYSAGVLVLYAVHRGDEYEHDKSELLTFAWWQVRGTMKAVVMADAHEILMPSQGDDMWDEDDDERERGVQDYAPAGTLDDPWVNTLAGQGPDYYGNPEVMEAYRKAAGTRAEGTCEVCWGPLPPRVSTGRPRRTCSERCRKALQRRERAGQ